jgi:hypothetical protein
MVAPGVCRGSAGPGGVIDRRGVAGPASLRGGLAPAPGGPRESVGRAAPAVRVDPQLLLCLLGHPLGGLGARGRYESLARVAGVGADPAASATIGLACSCAALMTSAAAASARAWSSISARCASASAPIAAACSCASASVRSTARLSASARRRAPSSVASGLEPRPLDHACDVGFLAGDGALTCLQLRAFVRECLARIGAREPPADQFEVPGDLGGS